MSNYDIQWVGVSIHRIIQQLGLFAKENKPFCIQMWVFIYGMSTLEVNKDSDQIGSDTKYHK